MHYFGFFNNVRVRYFRTRSIVESILERYRFVSPFKTQLSWTERFTTWIFRATYIDYGALNCEEYRRDLVDKFVFRVRSEHPKSISIVGLNHGGFNFAVLLYELHRRHRENGEFCDIIPLIKSAHLVGVPMSLPSDFSLLDDRTYPIYQHFSATDDIANIPLNEANGGYKIKDLVVIPLRTHSLIPFPHTSFFITVDLYEYLSHLIVYNEPFLIDQLKGEPAYNLDVFVQKGVINKFPSA